MACYPPKVPSLAIATILLLVTFLCKPSVAQRQSSSSQSTTSSSSTRGGLFAALQSMGHLFMSQTADVSYVPLRTVFSTKTVYQTASCYIPEGQLPEGFEMDEGPTIEAKDDAAAAQGLEGDNGHVDPNKSLDESNHDGDVIEMRPIGKARRSGRSFFGLLNRERSTVLVGIIRTKVYTSTLERIQSVVGAFRCDDDENCKVCDGFVDDGTLSSVDRLDQPIEPTKSSSSSSATSNSSSMDDKSSASNSNATGSTNSSFQANKIGTNSANKPSAALPFVDRNAAAAAGSSSSSLSSTPGSGTSNQKKPAGTSAIDGTILSSGASNGETYEDPAAQVELLYVQPEKTSVLGGSGGAGTKKPSYGGSSDYSNKDNAGILAQKPIAPFQPDKLKQSAAALASASSLSKNAPLKKEAVREPGDVGNGEVIPVIPIVGSTLADEVLGSATGNKKDSALKYGAKPALIKPALPEKLKPAGKNAQEDELDLMPAKPPALAPKEGSFDEEQAAPAPAKADEPIENLQEPKEKPVLVDETVLPTRDEKPTKIPSNVDDRLATATKNESSATVIEPQLPATPPATGAASESSVNKKPAPKPAAGAIPSKKQNPFQQRPSANAPPSPSVTTNKESKPASRKKNAAGKKPSTKPTEDQKAQQEQGDLQAQQVQSKNAALQALPEVSQPEVAEQKDTQKPKKSEKPANDAVEEKAQEAKSEGPSS